LVLHKDISCLFENELLVSSAIRKFPCGLG
jgi:hypothetical protein